MVAVCKNVLTGLGLINDEMERVSVLADPESSVLDSLLGVSSRDDIVTQGIKLDNLLLLLSVGKNTRDKLYWEMTVLVNRVLTELKLHKSMPTNNIGINVKYLRVLNKCMDIRDMLEIRNLAIHYDSVRDFLTEAVAELKYHVPQAPDLAALLIESLKFLQYCQETSYTEDEVLTTSMKNLLLSIADKYNYVIDFKYVTETRVPRNETLPTHPSDCSNDYNYLNSHCIVPKACPVENMYEREIIQYCLVLISSGPLLSESYVSLSKIDDFRLFVLSLLKQNDVRLSCAALRFLIFPYNITPSTAADDTNLLIILPYLIQKFDSQTVPWWFDPFENLISLLEGYNATLLLRNPVVSFLREVNLINGFMEHFFFCLTQYNDSKESKMILRQFIRFFSCCSAYDEKIRVALLSNKRLMNAMKRNIEDHISVLKDFIANKDVFIGSEVTLPPLYSSELAYAWLQLLKSFSRSTASLRTILKRNEMIKELLNLVRLTSSVLQASYFAGTLFLQAEMDILGVCLGCLCNFIVEFSSVDMFATDHGIVDMCASILSDPLFNPKISWRNLTRKMAFENTYTDDVKTNTLWVIRHLMYNSQNREKLDLLGKIPMGIILDFVNDPNWAVQQQCFQVLKNLTCNSRKVVNILLEKFRNVQYTTNPHSGTNEVVGSTYLFEFLVRKIRLLDVHDDIQKKTLVAILYIMVNITAINEHKKQIVIGQNDMLDVLYEILSETSFNNGSYGDSSELKLAVLWIMHNILWDPELMEYLQDRLSSASDESRRQTSLGDRFVQTDESSSQDFQMDEDRPDTAHNESRNVQDLRRPVSDTKAIERCEILRARGFYELVEDAAGNNDIGVRQKATSLLELMNSISTDGQV